MQLTEGAVINDRWIIVGILKNLSHAILNLLTPSLLNACINLIEQILIEWKKSTIEAAVFERVLSVTRSRKLVIIDSTFKAIVIPPPKQIIALSRF